MTITDVMTTDLVLVDPGSTAREAAQLMRERHIGDVLVVEDERLTGLVTDRDLAVRVLADDLGPDTPVSRAVTAEPMALTPDAAMQDAVALMREFAVRRVPVCDDDGHVLGIVTLGDLAISEDGGSALADISEAPPSRV